GEVRAGRGGAGAQQVRGRADRDPSDARRPEASGRGRLLIYLWLSLARAREGAIDGCRAGRLGPSAGRGAGRWGDAAPGTGEGDPAVEGERVAKVAEPGRGRQREQCGEPEGDPGGRPPRGRGRPDDQRHGQG